MKKFGEVFQTVFGAVGALLAIAVIAFILWWAGVAVVNGFQGIGNWWHDVTTQTAEEKAATDKAYADAEAEWKKDPTNPDVIAQKCIDNGGTPIISAWSGNVKECKGAENKSVNIEVNQ